MGNCCVSDSSVGDDYSGKAGGSNESSPLLHKPKSAQKKPASKKDAAAIQKRRDQRMKAVDELLKTEETYVNQLRDTIEYYMRPLSRDYCDNELPKEIEYLEKKIERGGASMDDSKMIDDEAGSSTTAHSKGGKSTDKLLAAPTSTLPPSKKKSATSAAAAGGETKSAEGEETEITTQPSISPWMVYGKLTKELEALKEKQKRYKQTSRILSVPDFDTIFSQMPTIYNVNKKFFEDLQRRYTSFDNDTTRIGDLFIEFTHYFKMYQLYFNKHEECISLLSSSFFMKSRKYADFIQSVKDAGRRGETGVLNGMELLSSLLILPIQRLPRYSMLLQVIVKNTEKGHPDLRDLNKSLSMVKETVAILNERIAEFERKQKVREIDSRFDTSTIKPPPSIADGDDIYKDLITDGTFVKPHRYVIKEGTMNKFDRTGKMSEATFILFNDILVYAITTSTPIGPSNLKLRQVIPFDQGFFVRQCTFIEGRRAASASVSLSGSPDRDSEPYILRQDLMDRGLEIWSSIKSFMVLCEDSDERDEWIRVLKETSRNCVGLFQSQVKALDSARKAGVSSSTLVASVVLSDISIALDTAEPLLIPDFLSDECMMPECSKKFSTLVRRHHCRYCGKIICSDCGKHSLPHKRIPSKMVKPVCDVCYDIWKSKQATAAPMNTD